MIHLKSFGAALGAAVCMVSPAWAAEGWGTDFNQGLATAAAEGRTALVEFTGSDWCPPCMFIRSKVFTSPAFKEFAEKNKLVLVELDFPRDETKVAPEVRAEREGIAQRYHVESFPTLMLMDGEGRVYARIEGSTRSVEGDVANLERGMEVKNEYRAKLEEAQKLSGTERAKALVEALSVLPENCRELHPDVAEDIVKSDPEDATGFRKAAEQKQLKMQQIMEFRQSLIRSTEEATGKKNTPPTPEDLGKIITATRAEAHKTLEREELLPEVRQVVLGFIAESYLIEKNYSQALEYMDKSIAAAPESAEVEQLKVLRARIQQLQK